MPASQASKLVRELTLARPKNSTCPFGAFSKGLSHYEKDIRTYRIVGDCYGRGADGLQSVVRHDCEARHQRGPFNAGEH